MESRNIKERNDIEKMGLEKTDQPYFKIAVYVFAVLAATVLFEKL